MNNIFKISLSAFIYFAIISLLMMYFIFPVFLAWPIYAFYNNKPTNEAMSCMRRVFTIPAILSVEFEWYNQWIIWQYKKIGIQ
jgi:hypothetical protein